MKNWLYNVFITNSTLGLLKNEIDINGYYNEAKPLYKIPLYLLSNVIRILVDLFHWTTFVTLMVLTLIDSAVKYNSTSENLLKLINLIKVDYNININGFLLSFILMFVFYYIIYATLSILHRVIVEIVSLIYYTIKYFKQ